MSGDIWGSHQCVEVVFCQQLQNPTKEDSRGIGSTNLVVSLLQVVLCYFCHEYCSQKKNCFFGYTVLLWHFLWKMVERCHNSSTKQSRHLWQRKSGIAWIQWNGWLWENVVAKRFAETTAANAMLNLSLNGCLRIKMIFLTIVKKWLPIQLWCLIVKVKGQVMHFPSDGSPQG